MKDKKLRNPEKKVLNNQEKKKESCLINVIHRRRDKGIASDTSNHDN